MNNIPENVHSTCELEVPGTRRKLHISFETVTPEMAEVWLESNSSKQRTLNAKTVE